MRAGLSGSCTQLSKLVFISCQISSGLPLSAVLPAKSRYVRSFRSGRFDQTAPLLICGTHVSARRLGNTCCPDIRPVSLQQQQPQPEQPEQEQQQQQQQQQRLVLDPQVLFIGQPRWHSWFFTPRSVIFLFFFFFVFCLLLFFALTVKVSLSLQGLR
jgi:hypothetical protein